jgi:hypothetical protein
VAKSPKFEALLAEMRALHVSKNGDYAREGSPFSNFDEAAEVARGFTGKDAVYATLIGVKLARLRNLLSSGKTPNNESIADTRRDLAMYAALWAADTLPWSYDDSRIWHNTTSAPATVTVTRGPGAVKVGAVSMGLESGGPHQPDATGTPVSRVSGEGDASTDR